MEELGALAERANSLGKTQTSDAHTHTDTHRDTQSTACRQGELAGTRECPRRAGAPGSSSRTATNPSRRQGSSVLEAEKAGREIEEGHRGRESTCISCSLTVTLSVTVPSQIHDSAFYRMPDVKGKSVPFTTPSCCSSGALHGCLAAFSPITQSNLLAALKAAVLQ